MKKIEFYFEEIKPVKIEKAKIRKVIDLIFNEENYNYKNVKVIFCSDSYLLKMNMEFLKHNYYTDIITFENSEDGMISGELYISFERVVENARLFNVSVKQEIERVIIHGILHLVKYKDHNHSEKRKMEEREDYYINLNKSEYR